MSSSIETKYTSLTAVTSCTAEPGKEKFQNTASTFLSFKLELLRVGSNS